MAVDPELGKLLNLLRDSPQFVLKEQNDGRRMPTTPKQITPDLGVVWVAATLTIADGRALPAVVIIDAAISDTPRAVYVWTADQWFEPAATEDRPALFGALGTDIKGVFPYALASHLPMALG